MATAGGVTIAIRVKPGAKVNRVRGRHDGPLGPALVVSVTAPAVDGRATKAALRAVADALGLRHADVALRRGEASRDKLILVTDPPAGLDARVRTLRDCLTTADDAATDGVR